MDKKTIILVITLLQIALSTASFAEPTDSICERFPKTASSTCFTHVVHGGYPHVDYGGCTIYGDKLGSYSTTLRCPKGHRVSREGLNGQVGSVVVANQKQAEDLLTHGLPCYGLDSKGEQCQEHLALEEVRGLLHGETSIENLNKQMSAWTSTASACHAGAGGTEDLEAPRVCKLRDQVIEAFNLRCPGKKTDGSCCGGGLAQIEGCNAATCDACGAKFCYLCLKPGVDATSVHAHARAHAGNYWEHRDGHTGVVPENGQDYQELEVYSTTKTDPITRKKRTVTVSRPYTYTHRYHWLIARGKLEDLFQEKAPSAVKAKAVAELEPLLRANKMWPFPAGKDLETFESWIEELHADSRLDAKSKIALLQNEHVFQLRQLETAKEASSTQGEELATHRAELAKATLISLSSPVLSSLDIGAHFSHSLDGAQAVNPHVTPLLENDEQVRNLYVHLRDREPGFFALGGLDGNQYRIVDPLADPARRVAPFVLSGEAPSKPDGTFYTHKEAAGWDENGVHHPGYCENVGALPPTKEQLEALGRAMTQNGRFNPNFIAGRWGVAVWSSALCPYEAERAEAAYSFNSGYGFIACGPRMFSQSVRCVRAVAW